MSEDENNQEHIEQMMLALMAVPMPKASCGEVIIAYCRATATIARMVDETDSDGDSVLEDMVDLIREHYDTDMDITIEEYHEH